VLDLPGTYSLNPTTLDEAITRDLALGRLAGEPQPQLVVLVADATHLTLSLRLILEVQRLGLPMVVALNMSDLARRRGYALDRARLAEELGVPVVETVAVAGGGADELIAQLERLAPTLDAASASADAATLRPWSDPGVQDIATNHARVQRILDAAGYREPLRSRFVAQADGIVMHPLAGMVVLAALLFVIFQAVFSWAAAPMEWIDASVAALGDMLGAALPDGLLRSLLVDGVIAGLGSVVIFLPQILVLFLFILALEDSGYLPRAAYLLDRVMGSVGLSGRAFIPLLSSFACAIPGIMATRTIPHLRDRIATIMIAPLMTCSARLPVYALLIAAFIPATAIGPFNLQGIVLFTLYFAGIVSAMAVGWVMKRITGGSDYRPLLLELPDYQWPNLRNLMFGLWERTQIFLTRVGGIILALTILLWFFSTFPAPPPNATQPDIYYSVAGLIGRGLETVFAPIGFNWQISIALVPGMAAREVAVSALGTVYALSDAGNVEGALAGVIATSWSFATALALLAWFVFAPQCLSTLAIVKRETNGWRYPLLMAGYLFGLAYVAAFITYRIALALS
jgi:ferrous iron transport protein B